MIKKTLTNYNDGTFSWGGEGQFYKEIPDHGTGKAAAFFRDLYYNNSEFEGRYYKAWSNTEHAVWLAVLFSSLFAGVLNIKAVQRAAIWYYTNYMQDQTYFFLLLLPYHPWRITICNHTLQLHLIALCIHALPKSVVPICH